MEQSIILRKTDFDDKNTFDWWFGENNISGDCDSTWNILCQFGEISIVVIMQD